MRRRRVLAMLGAAAGLAGCTGDEPEGAATRRRTANDPTETTRRSPTTTERESSTTTSIGGSVHGRPFRLGNDLELLEVSGTNWLHAFLDVRQKFEGDLPPEEDPDIGTLRAAKREWDVNLFVSLQWNFVGIFGDQPLTSLPPSGSLREADLFEHAVELLDAIGEPVDVVGLGNEPIWETPDEQVKGADPPLVPFTRNMKDYVVDNYTAGDPRYVVGAFNRLYNEHVWEEHEWIYEWLFELARTDDDVDGIDLHIHYAGLEQAEAMLEVARERFPDGMVTVTEFSPMWRYDLHVDTPIAAFEEAQAFAERYGIDDDTTVAEYLEAAKYDRMSHQEAADFYEVMPWYNVDFVEDMYQLLGEYDVEIGTFGFMVEEDVLGLDWTDDWAPFPINCLFQPVLIDTEHGAHPHYLDDFRRRA